MNVATPFVAESVVVPPRVPADAETVIDAVDDSTTMSLASRTLTTGCVAKAAPEPAPTGWVVTDNLVAVPATSNASAVADVCVSVTPSRVVDDVARILYFPAARAVVVQLHAPVNESAVHVEPLSVHVPVVASTSPADERVAIDNCTVEPTAAEPLIVRVDSDVKLSLADDPLSDASARSGVDTAGSEYLMTTIPDPPVPPPVDALDAEPPAAPPFPVFVAPDEPPFAEPELAPAPPVP